MLGLMMDRPLLVSMLIEHAAACHGGEVVVMTDAAHMPKTSLKNVLCYETLIAGESDALDWPQFDERSACSLCYTSGTTGNPKGALYSHRSTMLHTYAVTSPDAVGFAAT